MQCKGSYKGDPKGLQRGGRRRGQKISGNFIFQEFWDDMPRPGWSPWWVQRRPQTIPGPTFEPLTERPTRAPPESQGLPDIGQFTGNLRASYGQFTGDLRRITGDFAGNLRAICDELRAIYGPFRGNLRWITGDLRRITGELRAICGQLRAIDGQFTGNSNGNSNGRSNGRSNGHCVQEEWLPGARGMAAWAHKSPVLGTQIPSVGHTNPQCWAHSVYIHCVGRPRETLPRSTRYLADFKSGVRRLRWRPGTF